MATVIVKIIPISDMCGFECLLSCYMNYITKKICLGVYSGDSRPQTHVESP